MDDATDELRALAIVDLDRRLSRAAASGRGMNLASEQIDILISVGALDVLARAKTDALAVLARQRETRKATVAVDRPASNSAPISDGRMRARMIFASPRDLQIATGHPLVEEAVSRRLSSAVRSTKRSRRPKPVT